MKITILGAGAYALALSSILDHNNHTVVIWTDFIDEKEMLLTKRMNEKKLPGFVLSEKIKVTTDIFDAVKNSNLIIVAIPAQAIKDICIKIKNYIQNIPVLIASKGIDIKTGVLLTELMSNTLENNNIAVLSGPTFAKDIPLKEKIGLSVASKETSISLLVKKIFKNDYVDIDLCDDIIGVEICGAVKNIYAIVMGILDGLGCNESTKAMFIVKILKEIEKLIELFGGSKETLITYAGIGDVFLTCTSKSSRNYSFGIILTENKKENIKRYLENNTVEGVYTLEAINSILEKADISLPIIDALNKIIKNDLEVNSILSI